MGEVIVKVSKDGEMLGPVDRNEAHAQHIPHAAILAIITTPEDRAVPIEKIYTQVRALTREQYPGYMSTAYAGHIKYKAGFTLEELAYFTAISEQVEELRPTQFVPVRLVAQGFLSTEIEAQYIFVFRGTVDRLETAIDTSEVAELRELSMAEFNDYLLQGKVTPFARLAMQLIGLV